MKRHGLGWVLFVLASAGAIGACSEESRTPVSGAAVANTPGAGGQSIVRSPTPKPAVQVTTPPAPARPSCLLITMDTTRADRLGSYGYAKAQTPNLDRLAKNGCRFERAFAQVPYTLPSHASLFTGRYPPEHGIHVNSTSGLPADLPTLATAFAEHGYRTGAFVSAAVLESSYGLSRGFDVYDDDLGPSAVPGVIALARIGERAAESALAWLESEPDRPFFCWVHFYDPHASYDPPSPYRERSADPYDGEIAYMDAQIGRLTSWLEARDLLPHTLVIAAADHGESLGEHGEKTHGVLIYDATMHVPLLMSWPGAVPAGSVVATPVELVDVFPTVCALFGFDGVQGVHGRSLDGALKGQALDPRPIYGESEYCQINFGWGSLHSVANGPWKYIESPRPELYQRADDPREERDLAATTPQRVRELASELATLRASMTTRASTPAAVDSDVVAALAGLGYAQGRGSEDSTPGAERINPRDEIELIETFHTAIGLGQRGRFAEMIEPLQKVVAVHPMSVGFRTELGTAFMHVDRLEEAKTELAAALKIDPSFYRTHYALGFVYQKETRYEDALREFGKTLELQPEFIVAHTSMATCLIQLKRVDEALVHSRTLVEKKPMNSGYRIALARLLRDAGRTDEMKRVLEDALELADGGVRVYAAWEFATNPVDSVRDGARGVTLCEGVLAAGAPRDADLLDTLAAAYAEAGRFDEAVTTAEQAASIAKARGRTDLAEALTARLELYRAKKPFRAK